MMAGIGGSGTPGTEVSTLTPKRLPRLKAPVQGDERGPEPYSALTES